uniref:Uncharacterized protein n=1 Tax=Rhizophagus irregularis (strain DAOM 181602 / DAOM 197198 / MUCL 43194) TaxID=747089 RepID=U9SV50_RHIID
MSAWMPTSYTQSSGRNCGIVLAEIIVIILCLQFWALPRSDHGSNWVETGQL